MDLNDKTIALFQPNMSPGRYNLSYKQTRLTLKTVQPDSILKTYIPIRFNLLHFWPPVPSFALFCCVVEILSVYCFKRLFLYFTEFDGHFSCLNLAQI